MFLSGVVQMFLLVLCTDVFTGVMLYMFLLVWCCIEMFLLVSCCTDVCAVAQMSLLVLCCRDVFAGVTLYICFCWCEVYGFND